MTTYYNEFDPKKAAMLRALMADGHISEGDVDERSIRDVQPDDLVGYERCHFFAGIGLWDYALNLAGWPEGVAVWTGSCPCQPFSAAGQQRAKQDDRHLWPEWERLISECKPPSIFGEQVSAAVAYGWLDDVYTGLEAQGYAVGSAVLPACAVGAPHRRERLWFVAQSSHHRTRGERRETGEQRRQTVDAGTKSLRQAHGEGGAGGVDTRSEGSTVGNSKHNGRHERAQLRSHETASHERGTQRAQPPREFEGASQSVDVSSLQRSDDRKQQSAPHTLGNTNSQRPQGQRPDGHSQRRQKPHLGQAGLRDGAGHWANSEWLTCPDGKARLIEPSIPLLADGDTARVAIIHAAGDAIVPQVAAEFIGAFMEAVA